MAHLSQTPFEVIP